MSAGSIVTWIDQLGKPRYRLRFRDQTGKRIMETLPAGTSKRAAASALAQRVADVSRGVHRKPDSKLDFAGYAEAWLEAADIRPSTRVSYAVIVRHWIRALPGKTLAQVDPQAIRTACAAWTKDGASARTVNSRLAVLSVIFREAVADGLVALNPTTAVRRMKATRTVERPLSPAEIGRMLAAFDQLIAEEEDADKRDDATVSKMIFLVAVETAMRKGELLGLRWRSVKLADPEGARIEVTETRVVGETGPPKSEAGRRKLALSPPLAEALAQHLDWTKYDADDDLVLGNPRKGSAFDAMVYSVYFRSALVTADIEDAEGYRPFHGLRRTSLTNAAAAGVGVQALRTRAGHSSFSMTQEYISLADETFAEESALAAERLWGAT